MANNYLLDTSSRHCFVYVIDDLKMEVLGDIRIDLPDRLRVTMKISLVSDDVKLTVRNNLDLYKVGDHLNLNLSGAKRNSIVNQAPINSFKIFFGMLSSKGKCK